MMRHRNALNAVLLMLRDKLPWDASLCDVPGYPAHKGDAKSRPFSFGPHLHSLNRARPTLVLVLPRRLPSSPGQTRHKPC